LVLAVSGLLVVAVGVGTYLFDPELSGVRPSLGSGIDTTTGSRVLRDFLADQNAEAKAQVTGDQGQLEGYLTGNALQDVAQQIASNPPTPTATLNIRLQSLSVVLARDPNDPSVVIEVQEDAVKTLDTYPQNAAPTEQTLSFQGDFWMRESNGRYAITDQAIHNQPTSPLPAIGLAVLALIWVASAALLISRSRRIRVAPIAAQSRPQAAGAPPQLPATTMGTRQLDPSAELAVRTFGGLHLLHAGKDLVQELDQRPVTGFVWQRLLVGAIRDPAHRPSRDELGRQVRPGLDRQTQLKSVRNVVYQLRELPALLKDRILVEPQVLSFNFQGCQVDAVELLKASRATAGRASLGPAEADWAQGLFDDSTGIFLPDFEKADDLATDHRPTCMDMIKEVREMLTAKRIDLALALADTYLATGRPAQVIAVLEPLVREHTKRKDLADRLATAYRSAGRDAEADALAARFA
jgi:DNA-binding SARP family transcriptional activator